MTYVSGNRLEDFEFHDAMLRYESYQGNVLVVSAAYLNIHKGTVQNPGEFDQEIAAARITFTDFSVQTLTLTRAYQMDADGNLYTNDPEIRYEGKAAEEVLIAELKNGISVNGLTSSRENGRIEVGFDTTGKVMFNVACFCVSVKVEWDDYCGKAWYEK